MRQKKRILVCPLDWGLGHATRCIPIIRLLLQEKQEVIIAGSGRSFLLLQQEFPDLEFVDLPGYDIRYSKNAMALQMYFSIPKILSARLRMAFFWRSRQPIKNLMLFKQNLFYKV